MAWKGYAPYKEKTISSPNAQKNDDKVQKVKFVKDTNPVTGSRAARKQKPVTWS